MEIEIRAKAMKNLAEIADYLDTINTLDPVVAGLIAFCTESRVMRALQSHIRFATISV